MSAEHYQRIVPAYVNLPAGYHIKFIDDIELRALIWRRRFLFFRESLGEIRFNDHEPDVNQVIRMVKNVVKQSVMYD